MKTRALFPEVFFFFDTWALALFGTKKNLKAKIYCFISFNTDHVKLR